jgi:hypothetical protein
MSQAFFIETGSRQMGLREHDAKTRTERLISAMERLERTISMQQHSLDRVTAAVEGIEKLLKASNRPDYVPTAWLRPGTVLEIPFANGRTSAEIQAGLGGAGGFPKHWGHVHGGGGSGERPRYSSGI